ncbi:MAG: response regulator transcription factor [Caldilineaceae bacterium]|nr:response regulator transcription factor [Caldilineaceae bacterium]
MSGSKILVVDDEPSIGEVVSLYLEQAGYQVTVVRDGQAALDALAREKPDLLVLDLMLPKVDGLEITRRLRSSGNTPIIMLTARKEETDRIVGLEMGADDYVVKPFSPRELVSRVKAVLRRVQATPGDSRPQAVTFGEVRVDPNTRQVLVRGTEVSLTVKEFDLLWALATHPRQVFNRDQLLDLVWGITEYVDPSTVTVHVRRLREKIEADPSDPRHIQTIWGVGYRFDP